MVIIEHFMLSFIAYLLSFIFLFYILGRSEAKVDSDEYLPLMYLFDHPSVWFMLSLIITFFVNLVLFIKKRKQISTRSFMFDDNSKKVVIDFKRRYSNTMYQWDYSYSEINYLTSQKNIWLSSSKYRSIQI